MNAAAETGNGWLHEVTPKHWRVLWATILGWTFDGYETIALTLVAGLALKQLLPAQLAAKTPLFIGASIGLTLLGWAVGGVIGGIVSDYIGRKRTMMYSMLLYALFTGLTALSQQWWHLALLRFLTGVGIGSEWATGAAMIAETWPEKARAKGAGFMQAGFGIGTFLASFAWYVLNGSGPDAWRYMFLVGIVPAFFTLWIRTGVDEPDRWVKVNEERRTLKARRQRGERLNQAELTKTGFTLAALFATPETRKRVLFGLLLSLATTLGWWGIATWVPSFTAAAAAKAHLNPQHWASVASMVYNVGAVLGYVTFGFLADHFGRRASIAFILVGSLITTPWLYLWSHSITAIVVMAGINGYFTLGQFAWFAVYLPEMFPTAIRTTASGFIFNASRFIAFLGPFYAGYLIVRLGGFSMVALTIGSVYLLGLLALPFLPETRGKGLPA